MGAGRGGGMTQGTDRPSFNRGGGGGFRGGRGGFQDRGGRNIIPGTSIREGRDGRRFVLKPPYANERKWCHDKGLDMNILREIAILSEEIRNRFMKMDIPAQCLNSKVNLKPDNPAGELTMKICIGGAFYNRYVKAAYKNEDLLLRMKNNKFFNHDEASRSLILNKVSDFINDKHLK